MSGFDQISNNSSFSKDLGYMFTSFVKEVRKKQGHSKPLADRFRSKSNNRDARKRKNHDKYQYKIQDSHQYRIQSDVYNIKSDFKQLKYCYEKLRASTLDQLKSLDYKSIISAISTKFQWYLQQFELSQNTKLLNMQKEHIEMVSKLKEEHQSEILTLQKESMIYILLNFQ